MPLDHSRSTRHGSDGSLEQLGDEIAELASRLHAATYELLVLVHRFDEACGWHDGFASCAHWLHWRTGIDLGAAREKVRVSRALAALPGISQAMRRGELAYSKVRALTRVATPENEARLLAVARCGTTAHLERLVRAWRRVDRIEAAREEETRHLRRELTVWVDEDGMVVVRGRLAPESGALLLRALDVASGRLWEEARDTPPAGAVTEEVTTGQRRADALGRIAESALAHDLATGEAADRLQVVLHVEADALQADGHPGQAVLEETGHRVSGETSRRLACDGTAVRMRHAPDGSVLDVGRRTRTVPPAIRRALKARDRSCRFPGCTARHCDAHHVQHWADGGPTRLGNLLLLCRRHHRAVHEGGITLRLEADGEVAFQRPDGRWIEAVPPPPPWQGRALGPVARRLDEARTAIGPRTATPGWHGERFDVGWAVDVLRAPPDFWLTENAPGGLAIERPAVETYVGT